MKESAPNPASTLVERVAQTADTLAGRVKQLEKELEQAELWCFNTRPSSA